MILIGGSSRRMRYSRFDIQQIGHCHCITVLAFNKEHLVAFFSTAADCVPMNGVHSLCEERKEVALSGCQCARSVHSASKYGILFDCYWKGCAMFTQVIF